MPLDKELYPIDGKKLKGTDDRELTKHSFTYFHRLSFQVQIERERTLCIVTKLKTVQFGEST